MTPTEELFSLAARLAKEAEKREEIITPELRELEKAANEVGRSFSGSWLGYHSTIYYKGFRPPPPGARFSQEWGLMSLQASDGTRGDWEEMPADDVENHIRARAGNPDNESSFEMARNTADVFEECQSEIISILETESGSSSDSFLDRLLEDVRQLEVLTPLQVAKYLSPKAQFMTRDSTALGQGTRIPPHVSVVSEIRALDHAFDICEAAEKIARRAASHLERRSLRVAKAERVGTNVFIGHGQSPLWRELKDFIQDRLHLPWDEFNRVPVAGVTNIARLSEMLDAASIAFLVMTAEDELADGGVQARMNVIHEAGLFQGRLGFTRAVVMLEEGCKEFSNIEGLGQIRFRKGEISSAFEEVRRVLEREDLINETMRSGT